MKWHRRWRGRRRRKPSGVQKQTRRIRGVEQRRKGRPQEGRDVGRGWTDGTLWSGTSCDVCVQWRRSCKCNRRLGAWRKEGSDGKVFEEEVDTGGGFVPCTPLSFSGFPSLDADAATAAAALSASSPGPHASISGFWFGQTKKRQKISEMDSEGFYWIWGFRTKSHFTENALSCVGWGGVRSFLWIILQFCSFQFSLPSDDIRTRRSGCPRMVECFYFQRQRVWSARTA